MEDNIEKTKQIYKLEQEVSFLKEEISLLRDLRKKTDENVSDLKRMVLLLKSDIKILDLKLKNKNGDETD